MVGYPQLPQHRGQELPRHDDRGADHGRPGRQPEDRARHAATHPNVGPFIGRQLIQRLVTSNPSPAYVARVAAAFNNNGTGVRGDLKAVVKAVLLRPRSARRGQRHRAASCANRCCACGLPARLRATAATPATGASATPTTRPLARPDAAALALGVQLLPPGLRAAGHAARRAGLVAPEMQIAQRDHGGRLRELHARQRQRRRGRSTARRRHGAQPPRPAARLTRRAGAGRPTPPRWSTASTAG